MAEFNDRHASVFASSTAAAAASPAPCGVDVERAHRRYWSLVVTKDTGSVAASLSPVEHAWSDDREYLIGALEDGWWLAVEVDGG